MIILLIRKKIINFNNKNGRINEKYQIFFHHFADSCIRR